MINKVFPGPLGHENNPRLISMGKQTAEMVAHFLPTAQPTLVKSNYGLVELSPGSIWSGDNLLVYVCPEEVFFTTGDTLHSLSVQKFIEERWPVSTLPINQENNEIVLVQDEKESLQSIFVPWYVTLGLSPAKIGLFYSRNHDTLERLLYLTPALLQILNTCRYRYHKLFMPIPSSTDAGFAINHLSLKCNREGVAYFIARLLKNPQPPNKTLGAVERIVSNTIAIVIKTIDALEKLFYMVVSYNLTKIVLMYLFPPAGALMPWVDYETVKERAITEYSEYLAARMGEEGYFLSQSEATEILRDLVNDPGTILKLRDLEGLLIRFIPIIKHLHTALYQSN
ncbi:MAG: hypothetical protein HY819_24260 [Acidobacteria bacterium]|nr:hypothetical protein [Acidobacteriota bacterium]